MTVVYSKSEKKGTSAKPVVRDVAVGNAAGDATAWMPLGDGEVTFAVYGATINGTRYETDQSAQSREVAHYRCDAGSIASSVVIETKQSYEDDDQARVLTTITGPDYAKNMVMAELGDYVRLRILTKDPADEAVYMAMARRGSEQ
ncbi:hypothetical protein [Thalassobius sp. Cn5-15]|uniref:hypothetical protein n=1 Tax=Thalassobius sp. Cn5-15 TaxID=2917763 RepID=UPI001EF180FB|nr:hypothetical protein [Thalassobius sp. Cn5-15]MCG7492483.1 hypothetical protein [Thalassobius sp. Cn5-15]